jgi:hypothetical protein
VAGSGQVRAGEEAGPGLPGYRWRVELAGPVARCRVPGRFVFVAADAIISGKIAFRGQIYYPRGRLEDTFAVQVLLVRRIDDPKPLVDISGQADGTWSGLWRAAGSGCTGAARVSPRRDRVSDVDLCQPAGTCQNAKAGS